MDTTTVASKVVASKSNRRTQEIHVEEAGNLFILGILFNQKPKTIRSLHPKQKGESLRKLQSCVSVSGRELAAALKIGQEKETFKGSRNLGIK